MRRQENNALVQSVDPHSSSRIATKRPVSAQRPTRGGLGLICSLAFSMSLVGCGSDLKVAPVSGTVTLDGAPLERASVLFQPETGRPSFGVTDSQGRYTLNYSMNQGGAEVGPCTVKISTAVQSEEDEGKVHKKPQSNGDKVPARYAKEPVKVKVEPKSNKIDIALVSKP